MCSPFALIRASNRDPTIDINLFLRSSSAKFGFSVELSHSSIDLIPSVQSFNMF